MMHLNEVVRDLAHTVLKFHQHSLRYNLSRCIESESLTLRWLSLHIGQTRMRRIILACLLC